MIEHRRRGWGILHRYTDECIDGAHQRVDGFHTFYGPGVFRTRREAREAIKARYGYIRNRPDLQAAPHGWRVPQAVKVEVITRVVE